MTVTPPAIASGICGSCGQTECSAQTSAVIGSVASLPSLWPRRAGRRVDAEVAVGVDDPGRHELAGAVHDRGAGRRAAASAPTATILPSWKSTDAPRMLRAGAGEDGGVPDQDSGGRAAACRWRRTGAGAR